MAFLVPPRVARTLFGMAITHLLLTCDFCESDDDRFESDEQAREFGWFFLNGPERELGNKGERVYCSLGCLASDLEL